MRPEHAHEFILDLRDWKHRTGYGAYVGERIIEHEAHEELLRLDGHNAKL
jgi:hypothetical protein